MSIEVEGIDDLLKMLDDLESDLTSLGMLPEEQSFVNLATDLVAKNFQEIWASDGAAIGENWGGNSLVGSGRLRNSFTNPTALRVSVQGNTITFGSNVPYASYVNNTYEFIGITQASAQGGSEIVDQWLRENAKLNWD